MDSVREVRPEAIKHLVKLSVEHDFLPFFFSKRKTCYGVFLKTILCVVEANLPC